VANGGSELDLRGVEPEDLLDECEFCSGFHVLGLDDLEARTGACVKPRQLDGVASLGGSVPPAPAVPSVPHALTATIADSTHLKRARVLVAI